MKSALEKIRKPKNAPDILQKRIDFNISLCKKSNGMKINLQRAAQNVVELQRGLTGSRALAGNGYMQKGASLQAYLLYYWPVSYAQTKAALQKAPRFFERVAEISGAAETASKTKKRAIRVLDLGSGPAPASCSLADLAQGRGEQNMAFEFCLCDSSGDAISLGKKILEAAYAKNASVETRVCNLENAFQPKNGAAFLDGKKFDFIIASHSLNELWKGQKKRGEKIAALLKNLSACLDDGGLMLLMEPALLATSRALIEARDSLIASGLKVASPCLQSASPCPALENPNATCHAQFDWEMPQIVADLAALAGLNRADVKMTYFVFEKAVAGSFGQEGDFGNGENSLQDQKGGGPNFCLATVPDFSTVPSLVEAPDFGLATETGLATAPSLANICALVVSEPMLNKAGRVRYVLCDGKARFTLSAKNGDPNAAAQGFFDLKRYDKIKIAGAQVRSQKGEPLSLGFDENTRLEFLL
ncbi:MAG: methyltransferase domain-containing protein [Treponema sp.]|nr:methyltransferase domain-containing protein [Treponema sp.]